MLYEHMLRGHQIPRGLENINLRDRMQAILTKKGVEIEGYPVETDEIAERQVKGWETRRKAWERMEVEAKEREERKREQDKRRMIGRKF